MKRYIGLTFLTCCIIFACVALAPSGFTAQMQVEQTEQVPLNYADISEIAEKSCTYSDLYKKAEGIVKKIPGLNLTQEIESGSASAA